MNCPHRQSEMVEEMIRHATEAGRLRIFAREYGPGLWVIESLAERYSQMATAVASHIAKTGGNLL